MAALRRIEAEEMRVVHLGRVVAVVRTHAHAPHVLIANSNLVPHWTSWEHYYELGREVLII